MWGITRDHDHHDHQLTTFTEPRDGRNVPGDGCDVPGVFVKPLYGRDGRNVFENGRNVPENGRNVPENGRNVPGVFDLRQPYGPCLNTFAEPQVGRSVSVGRSGRQPWGPFWKRDNTSDHDNNDFRHPARPQQRLDLTCLESNCYKNTACSSSDKNTACFSSDNDCSPKSAAQYYK